MLLIVAPTNVGYRTDSMEKPLFPLWVRAGLSKTPAVIWSLALG